MKNALIGFSGFVGSTLLKQSSFESLYRSTNIHEIEGESFETVVCAGAPAQKWIANRNPNADFQKIDILIRHLKTIRCKTFILVSTVDVFKSPNGVDENTPVDEVGLHAYGLHRRMLERFVEANFPHHLIIRLPGLVGPGLRKNIIFDLLNKNNLQAVESRSAFQFYPMINLWFDIQIAVGAGLKLVHLTAEPTTVAVASRLGFGRPFEQTLAAPHVNYDLRTRYADAFGSCSLHYQYTLKETIQAIRAYAQSEPLTIKLNSDAPL